MKINKLLCSIFSITSAFFIAGHSESSQVIAVTNPTSANLPNQTLIDALSAIGVPLPDVLAYQQSGQASDRIIKAVNVYANDSSNLIFNNLSQNQSNALVLFSFALNNEKKLSDQSLQDLMRSEKLRAGMSTKQIDKLESLTKKLLDSSSYELSAVTIAQIKETMPFITANPFAFADTIGPLIGALIYNSENGSISPSPEIEQGLTDASQQLTGLTDAQITNITNVTNTYKENNTFEPTDDSINDMNQALAIAALPLGAYTLYPLLGYSTVAEVNNVTGTYGHYFNQGSVYRWNNVATRQGYYNDASYNRQNNVNQRESNADNAAQQRQGTVSKRQSNVNEAESNRQGNINQRQSNVNAAEGRSNLNRDNARNDNNGGGRR